MSTTIFLTILIIIAVLVFAFQGRFRRQGDVDETLREPFNTILLAVVLAAAVIILTDIYDDTYFSRPLVGAARLVNTAALIYAAVMRYRRRKRA